MKKLHWIIATVVLSLVIGIFAVNEITKERFYTVRLNDGASFKILKPIPCPDWEKNWKTHVHFINPVSGKNDSVATEKLTNDSSGFYGGGYYTCNVPLDSTKRLATIFLDSSLLGKEPPQRPILWRWYIKGSRFEFPTDHACVMSFFLAKNGDIYPDSITAIHVKMGANPPK